MEEKSAKIFFKIQARHQVANSGERHKSDRKTSDLLGKMTILKGKKEGAITPPTNQSPDFNVNVAYKM
jgi:hypothetical protein